VLEQAGAGISNDFERPVFSRYPRLGEIRDALLERGAADAALAGSGSAVFGVFRTQRRRAEPLVHSRKIRFSSSKLYPGKTMAVHSGGV